MNDYSLIPFGDFSWFCPKDWEKSRFSTLNYLYTGYSLIKEIKDNEWVLDVGCGINPFKKFIKNLIGIDPIKYNNSLVDVVTKLETYNTEQKFDVFFCLGSLSPICKTTVYNQFNKIKNLAALNYRVYIRIFNCKNVIWNEKFVDELCNDFNLKCIIFTEEQNIKKSNIKNNNSNFKKHFIKLESL